MDIMERIAWECARFYEETLCLPTRLIVSVPTWASMARLTENARVLGLYIFVDPTLEGDHLVVEGPRPEPLDEDEVSVARDNLLAAVNHLLFAVNRAM